MSEEIIIPKNCLWQYLEKKHLDPDNKLSDDDWEEFVDECVYSFAEEVSKVGQEFLEEWIT